MSNEDEQFRDPASGSEPPATPGRLSADDVLPPVEPPSAGFIVQLFVVPAAIVLVIVGIYLLFNRLASSERDPRDYVQAIQRNNVHSWQAAHDLAEELQRNPKLKGDRTLAAELERLLELKLETPLPDAPPPAEENAAKHMTDARQSEIALRVYLVHALGEFTVPEGFEGLLKAAATDKNDSDRAVQGAAVMSLAVMLGNVPEWQGAPPAEIEEAFLRASREERGSQEEQDYVRKVATYALGVLGTPPARERLVELLQDTNVDVRYNAAAGLARLTDPRSVPTLVEMLDPNEDVGVRTEEPETRLEKRVNIYTTALQSTEKLAAAVDEGKLTAEDVKPLADQLQALSGADLAEQLPGSVGEALKDKAGALAERLRGK